MKFLKPLIIILLATGAMSLAEVPTPSAPGPLVGEKVGIRILRFGTPESGAKTQNGSAGGGGLLYASAGFVDENGQPTGALCSGSIGSTSEVRDPDTLRGNAAHLWTVEARVLEAHTEQIRFEIDWARYDATGGGRSERVRGDHRVITLGEGETHVLDFVDRKPGENPNRCSRNVTIEIEAGVGEDPQFAETRLGYDLWLVDESPDGTRRTRHIETVGAQGEGLDAGFDLMRWPVRDAHFPDGITAEVAGEVSLSARGRLRQDGTIDVYLQTERMVGVVPAGGKPRGGVGAFGERTFSLDPGEALEIVLPTPGGSHAEWIDREARGSAVVFKSEGSRVRSDGVSTEEGMLRVDFKRFFAGNKMSLIVTVRPES